MKKLFLIAALLSSLIGTAYAHPGAHIAGFEAGFLHPFNGLDHALVMLAVGLMAVAVGSKKATWQLPILFIMTMVAGLAAGFKGFAMPMQEVMLTVSLGVTGLLLLFKVQLKAIVPMVLIAVFGFMHGAAHGVELSFSLLTVSGILIATALLHALGLLAIFLEQHHIKLVEKVLAATMLLVAGLALV